MPAHKEHHFVPQFFLRNFARPGERCVRAFNIARRRHTAHASIASQCCRPYLYGRDPALEHTFGELEGEASAVFRSIIAHNFHRPQLEDARVLYSFVMLQLGRTPRAADEFNLWATKAMRAILRTHPAPPPGLSDGLKDLRMEHPAALDIAIVQTYKAWPVIKDLDLAVLVNETGTEFVTGDVPVVLHNQYNHDVEGVGVLGFACSGLQIFLPIDPRHTLLFYDLDVYSVRASRMFVKVRDERLVKQLNALQAIEAVENLYYRSAPTAADIDALPWHLRRSFEHFVESAQFQEDGGNRKLVVSHRRMSPVRISSPVIEIRTEARGAPRDQRAHSWRPHAVHVAEQIFGRPDSPNIASGTTFSRVE